jgi:hypothetical protein
MPPFQQPFNTFAADPTQADVLALHRAGIFTSMNCHHVGTVREFDATNQTAKATINYKQTVVQPNADTGVYQQVLVDYPILVDCPVVFLGGGASALTFPVAAGDECLILFNDRDFDDWFSGSNAGQPPTPRAHSFSDGIIVVGIRSLANVLSGFDSTRASLRNGAAAVAVGPSLVKIYNASHTLNALLQELVAGVNDLVGATAGLTVICSGGGMASSTPINVAQINAAGSALAATANKIAELLE